MAKEWGVSIDHNGYANEYQIECDGLTILDLNAPEYTMLHWLTILLENREFDASTPLAAETKDYLLQNFHLDYKTADVIIVPMTATFPLPLTLSTVQSRIASCVTLCALANWVSNLY